MHGSAFGVILGLLAPVSGQISRVEAIAIMVPMMLLLGFGLVSLSPITCAGLSRCAPPWRGEA